MRKNLFCLTLFISLASILWPSFSFGQRTGYSKEEFTRRRNALMEKVPEGMIILFGEALPQPAAHFRQDNDFYYFTGVEDVSAILLLAPKMKESYLFLPQQEGGSHSDEAETSMMLYIAPEAVDMSKAVKEGINSVSARKRELQP